MSSHRVPNERKLRKSLRKDPVAEQSQMKLVDSRKRLSCIAFWSTFSLSSAIRNFTTGTIQTYGEIRRRSKSLIWLRDRVILVSLRYGNRRLPPVPLPSKRSIGQQLRFGTATLASLVSGRISQISAREEESQDLGLVFVWTLACESENVWRRILIVVPIRDGKVWLIIGSQVSRKSFPS